MPGKAVRIADPSERALLEASLLTAFASDPFTRWVLARPDEYLALFPQLLRHMGGGAFGANAAYATEGTRAAALWLPPGVEPDAEALGMAMATATLPEAAPSVFEQMAGHHPSEPHWYLPFIGVDPAAQGQGHGTALLRASLQAVDRTGLPAYLESTNPRNIPLYESFGFRVTGEIQAGDSPPMHPMWRAAAHH